MGDRAISNKKPDTLWSVLLKNPATPKPVKIVVAAELCLVPLAFFLFAVSPLIFRALSAIGLVSTESSKVYFLGAYFPFLTGGLAARFSQVDLVLFEFLAWASMFVFLLRISSEVTFFSQMETVSVVRQREISLRRLFVSWLVTGPLGIFVVFFLDQERLKPIAALFSISPPLFLAFQICYLIFVGIFLVEGFILIARMMIANRRVASD